MFEKVNPSHPDKVADRIAGAVVDLAYKKQENPKIAVEVLIGHGNCHIIAETSIHMDDQEINEIVKRILGEAKVDYLEVPQDQHLAQNQKNKFRCGDNGIFKGVPMTREQRKLSKVAHSIYRMFNSDGKYILDNNKLIICQSNAPTEEIKKHYTRAIINPLGDWTGGFNVDAGATNRKLGSDMADSVTGGGLHGKDCSKADVSINIYLWQIAQEHKSTFTASCAIGDDTVTIYKGEEIFETLPYAYIVLEAKTYIESKGGFEKFAEWGLV